MTEKNDQYVADVRQWVRDYQEMMKRAWGLQNDYGLYGTILIEDDMPDAIMPHPIELTKLESFKDAFANIQSIFADFDAGIDTNFERVS